MQSELIKRAISSIILIPAILLIINSGGALFNFFIILILFIAIYEWKKISLNKTYNYIGLIFLMFVFYTIYKIREDNIDSHVYLLFILLISISTDIGGYIFGKIFKGPTLTKISPNKTFSGMFGSYFLSQTAVFFFISFHQLKFYQYQYYEIFLFTLFFSTINQIGDLIISYFKRLSNLKDTGNIIPGHGGILDRIDGIIFTYFFANIFYFLGFFKI